MAADQVNDDHGNDAAGATALHVGDTATGIIDSAADADYFVAALTSGQLYRVVLTPLSGKPVFDTGDVAGTVTGAPRILEASSDRLVWTGAALLGGDYWQDATLSVIAPNGPASYRISLEAINDDYANSAATTGTLAVGGTFKGKIDVPGDADWIALELTGGQAYQFRSSGVAVSMAMFNVSEINGSAFDLDLHPDGSFIPSSSGKYYLQVGGKTAGAYAVSMTKAADDIGDDATHPATLAVDTTLAGRLDFDADKDAFKVHAIEGHGYQVTYALNNGAAGTAWMNFQDMVYEQGIRLEFVHTGNDDPNTITFRAAYDFDLAFTLSMSGWQAPTGYTISYRDLGADDFGDTEATAGHIVAPSVTAAHLDGERDVDAMRVTLPADAMYRITLGGALATDPGEPGVGLALSTSESNRDPSGPKQLTVIAQPGEDTVFYVRDYWGRGGNYTVSVAPVADTVGAAAASAGRLAVGSNVEAALEAAGDHDWFAVDLQANTTYFFEAENPVTQLAIVDAVGKTLSDLSYRPLSEFRTTLGFTPATSGTYYLDAGGTLASVGEYGISAAVTSRDDHPGPAVLPLGTTVSGKFDFPGDVDSFWIDLQAGHMYTFSIFGVGPGANGMYDLLNVKLAGMAGDTLTVDYRQVVLVPETTGRYRLSFSPEIDRYLTGYQLTLTDHGGGHATVAGGAPNRISTAGNDVLLGHPPDWTGAYPMAIDGGAGIDTVVYSAPSVYWPIHAKANGSFSVGVGKDNETDTLSRVERVFFAKENKTIALDVGAGAIGGEAYRLYQAAFDRTPDQAGVGYWMSVLERGASLRDVAAGFIASEEFKHLYGANLSNMDFVDRLYVNVLHRMPDGGGHDYWIGRLEHGAARADILASFSESQENVAAVAQIIGDGFQYTPPH